MMVAATDVFPTRSTHPGNYNLYRSLKTRYAIPSFDFISQDEARQVVGYLMRRAATDASFRQGLLTTPRATLEREFDMVLPPDFNLRFVENPNGELVIALPEPAATDALSDDDLEAVAGGLQGMVLDVFSTCFSREHLARIQSRLTQTQGDSL